jgi:signal transduction histidine kinase
MADPQLLTRLAQHRAVGSAPAAEHEWLARHGTLRTLAVGEVLTPKGEAALTMTIVLTGHIVIRVDRGAGSHKIFEWRGGDVGGLLPFSRSSSPPNDAVAEEVTELLEIPREHLPELIRECPVVTAAAVWAMLDRARQFTSGDLRDEKLLSLGRLAAGLAHELNNPASAVVRSAKSLAESLAGAEAAAQRLAGARLSDAQLAAIEAVRQVCLRPARRISYSALSQADREDTVTEWLDAHAVSTGCAAPLAETGLTLDQLDTLAASLGGDALDAALQWIAAGCQVRALASGIETAGSRINDLVGAVKGFTFMDHAPAPEPVDISHGITDTFTMLGAKIRGKSIAVSVDIAADLPRVHAVGAELNQVWMNLIDNAVDAVAEGGQVEVIATRAPRGVLVRVIDDGPGIPPEIQGRIFDPFFTTKGVGQGTGLGLDIVRRLIKQHEGEIEVESRPGRTEFRVTLRAVP